MKFTDLFAMLDDIKIKSKEAGRPAEVDDAPAQLLLGYRLDDQTWRISLTMIKKAILQDPVRWGTVKSHLGTAAGRTQLAQILFDSP